MIVSFYLTVKPTAYNGKITWAATASSQKPQLGLASNAGAKTMKVNLDIPDDELEIPEITIPWPVKTATPTPDIIAEVQGWTK